MRRALLAAVALGALAAPAQAAYAPRLSVRVDPATPYTPSAVTATLRQAPGESANRTEVIRFPPAFGFNPGFSVTGCTPEQEAAEACPDASRIGVASADTDLGSFSGPIYLTRDFRTLIFLRGFGGLVQTKVEGVMRMGADGWVESVLDGLPPVRSTFGEVRLEAGPRSLVLTPRQCGDYPVDGRFASHDGDVAASRATVRIAGCDPAPSVSGLRARPRGRRVEAAWQLGAAASRVEIVLERRTSTRSWIRWRRVARSSAAAAAGPGRRLLGRRLAAGRYRVTVVTYGARGGLADTARAETTVR